MKKLITFICSLFYVLVIVAQPKEQYLGTSSNIIRVRGKLTADSAIKLSIRDTGYVNPERGDLVVRPQDSIAYMYNGSQWAKLGSADASRFGLEDIEMNQNRFFDLNGRSFTFSDAYGNLDLRFSDLRPYKFGNYNLASFDGNGSLIAFSASKLPPPIHNMRVNVSRVRATNAAAPLTTPTYDGSGQTTHPSIRYFPDSWNGFKYWMAHTPYPDGNDDYENPSMLVSQDGLSWINPPGLTNPIEPPPVNLSQYWADPEIEVGPNDSMYLFFIDQTTNVYVRASANGTNWTPKTKIISNTVQTILSPTVYYDKSNYTWVMYYVNMAGSPNVIQRRTAASPYGPWSIPNTCSFSNVPSGRDLWHMSLLKTNDQWHAFVTISDLDTYTNGALHFAASSDGITFTMTATPVLDKSAAGWDNRNIYRTSALLIDKGKEQVYGLWYSASSTASTFGNWRIGYAEMSLGGPWFERNNTSTDFNDTTSVKNLKASGLSNLKDLQIWSAASNVAQPTFPIIDISADRATKTNSLQVVDNYGGYVGEREQGSLLPVLSFGPGLQLTKHPLINARWAPVFSTPATINLTWARVIGDKSIGLTAGNWTFAQNTANRPHATIRGFQNFLQSSAGTVNISIGNGLSGGYSHIATTQLEAAAGSSNLVKVTGTLGNYASDFYLAGYRDTLETAYHFYAGTPRKDNTESWINNLYGLYIASQNGASNKYALYQAGTADSTVFEGPVRFKGSVTGIPGGGGGVTDHGALTGLSDDDHPQYLYLPGRAGQTILDRIDIGGGSLASSSPALFVNVNSGHTGQAFAIGQNGNPNYFSIDKSGNINNLGGNSVRIQGVGGMTGAYFPDGISFIRTASAQNGGAFLKGLSFNQPWAFDNSAVTADGVSGLVVVNSNATNPGNILELKKADNSTMFSVSNSGTATLNGVAVIAGTIVTGTGGINKYLQTSVGGVTYYIPMFTSLPN